MSQKNNGNTKSNTNYGVIKSEYNDGAISIKGRRSLLSLTESILKASKNSRQFSKWPIDNSWMEKIWAWADEFELTEEQIPRIKESLLALEKLHITTR